MRLKMHLVMESNDGERLVEVKEDELLPEVFLKDGFNSGYDTLLRYLDMKVMSPIRGGLRERLGQLYDEGPYKHYDGQEQIPGEWPGDSEAVDRLEATLAAVFRSRDDV